MKHTLVTFLGRTQRTDSGGYRQATYRFPDGFQHRSAYLGLTLTEYLKPDRVVILGTPGSMWSVLVENLSADNAEEVARVEWMEARMELIDAEGEAAVSRELLRRVQPLMRRALGCAVSPRLIPFGRDAEEQYEILDDIGAVLQAGRASFDLTHGFRHLGMVGFMSAFMLERVRNLSVEGLWYGALDMTGRGAGATPVLKLDGLMRVRRWVDALDRFDANGDYGVFAPLLIEDGVPEEQARFLERAAFHERVLNLSGAAREIRSFAPVLDEPLAGASELFRKQLRERIDWARARKRSGGPGASNWAGVARISELAEQQRRLAFKHLERRDFIRASIFGWEALTTRECDRRGFTASDYYQGRKPAIEEFEKEIKAFGKEAGHGRQHPERDAFFRLRTVRNALVHGNPPKSARDRAMLKDPGRLHRALEEALRSLLGGGG